MSDTLLTIDPVSASFGTSIVVTIAVTNDQFLTADSVAAVFDASGDLVFLQPAASVAVTDEQILAAVRSLIIDLCGVATVKGQVNRVPEPDDDTYVVIIPGLRTRLGTNVVNYYDPVPLDLPGSGLKLTYQPMQVSFQVDAHGPGSADLATIISTMIRDDYSCQYLTDLGLPIQPLFTSDPRQLAFTNEGGQTEDRWSIDVVFQCNVVVSTAQQFAGTLSVTNVYPQK